jgi:hypothetical protein
MSVNDDYEESQWGQQRGMRRESGKDPRYGGPVITSQRKPRQKKHFCKRDVMHLCTVCESKDRQKTCDFCIPSTFGNHCMELRFDEFCGNHILHQYISGVINDSRATALVRDVKKKHSEIQSRVEGYHIIFPLEGEETVEDLQDIYNQLTDLGMNAPEFWLDKNGKSAKDYKSFSVTTEDIKDGTWCPKQRELTKDILKYLDIREKLGY